MNKARARRTHTQWLRYLARCNKLNAGPCETPWERAYHWEYELWERGHNDRVRRIVSNL